MTLLADMLEHPLYPASRPGMEVVHSFVQLLRRMEQEEGCDFQRIRAGLADMERITRAGIVEIGSKVFLSEEAEVSLSELLEAHSPPKCTPLVDAVSQALLVILSAPAGLMRLAQGLMGNLYDASVVRRLARLLKLRWEGETLYGPFGPDMLMPETYDFIFRAGN
jgi:hypothetical protein